MKTKKPKIEVRWIDDDDPAAIVEIARACFGPPAKSSSLAKTLADMHQFMSKTDHIPKVLRVDGKVVAYLFYRLEKGLVMVEELAAAKPRQGYGKRLIKHLKQSLRRLRRRIIAVRVPESNLPAQLFFKSLGFTAFRVVKRRNAEPLYAMKYVTPNG